MRNKKILFSLIAVVLLVAVMLCSLTACLKIAMKKNNVIKRLSDYGATVSDSKLSSPLITGWQSANIVISDIIQAVLNSESDASVTVGGDDDEEGVNTQKILYVFYAGDKASADWIYNKCKEYKESEEHSTECANWGIYTYDNDHIVMVGDNELLAVARTY